MTVTTASRIRTRRLVTQNFPVTILFGAQYGALVLFPAIIHQTEHLRLIVMICVIGIGTAFSVEAVRSPLAPRNAKSITISPDSAMCIVGIGWLAAIGGSITGGVAYVNQTTSANPSHLAAVFTPLTYWLIIGTALVMAQAAQGIVSRSRAWGVISFGFALEMILEPPSRYSRGCGILLFCCNLPCYRAQINPVALGNYRTFHNSNCIADALQSKDSGTQQPEQSYYCRQGASVWSTTQA